MRKQQQALRHRILLHPHSHREPWKTFEFRATRCNTINHFYPRQNIEATIPRRGREYSAIRISISRSYFSRLPFIFQIFNAIVLPSCNKNNSAKEGEREGEEETRMQEVCQTFLSLFSFFFLLKYRARTLFNRACAPCSPRPRFAIIARLKRFEGEIVKLHDNGGGV